jgi:hypothetical protein
LEGVTSRCSNAVDGEVLLELVQNGDCFSENTSIVLAADSAETVAGSTIIGCEWKSLVQFPNYSSLRVQPASGLAQSAFILLGTTRRDIGTLFTDNPWLHVDQRLYHPSAYELTRSAISSLALGITMSIAVTFFVAALHTTISAARN